MRKLNELEGVCLGVIQKNQPCTAYMLRTVLKASPSSHWRASAGAIYPLIARLEDEELITGEEDENDRRGRKLLSITARGKKAFKAWIREITNPDLIADVYDPLRSRVFFLDALSDGEQQRFADDVLGALNQYQKITETHLADRPASEDLYEHLGALGGAINAQSRVAFHKKLLAAIRRKVKT